VLHDAYGYSITMPETFGTFHANLNHSTGQLLIRGGAGASNDRITVARSGTELIASVDVGNDVPGTGPTDAFVSRFALGSVKSVVVQAGDGADVISLQGLGGSSVSSVEVLAGGGDDGISLPGLGSSGGPGAPRGGPGSDTLAYSDPVIISTDPFALPVTNWTITGRDAGTVKNVLFGSVENLVGGKAKDVFTFPSSASEVTGRVNGGGGSNWLNYSD